MTSVVPRQRYILLCGISSTSYNLFLLQSLLFAVHKWIVTFPEGGSNALALVNPSPGKDPGAASTNATERNVVRSLSASSRGVDAPYVLKSHSPPNTPPIPPSMPPSNPSPPNIPLCLCNMPRSPQSMLADAPKLPVDVTKRGVKLCFLVKLVEQGLVDGAWTIQEVVERFVRPKTAATQCCLFDVIREAYTGHPRFFISHTWSRRLKDLLSLLRSHFVEGVDDDTLLWLDIVAINQHPYVDKGCLLQDDVASLASVVQATEQTLFCLDDQCVVLTRIWCLFEVWQTFLAKGVSGLMVLMPDVDSGRLEEVLNTFDVMQLKAALVSSAQYEAKNTRKTGVELAVLLNKGGSLCQAIGQYKTAESLYQQAFGARKCVLGADHVDNLTCISNLADCIGSQGRYPEAETMYREVLQVRKRALGVDHPDTIDSINKLARCIYDQGRYKEAEPMIEQALEARKRVLNANDLNTIDTIANLANCINDQGRHQEAEPMYQQVFEVRKRVLGADHPNTIGSISNLAKCINGQGRFQEAEPMYEQVLEVRKRVLGADHPVTIGSISNLADCINGQGRYTEAETMYQHALEARKRVLGADHPDTITSISNLAGCINGQARTGVAALRQCYEQEPLDSISNLASCIDNQERYPEAEALYQQALEARKRVLGADHPKDPCFHQQPGPMG
eukprot:gene19508-26178_t